MAANTEILATPSPVLESCGGDWPDWRRQSHSWFLAGLVIANLAFTAFVRWLMDNGAELIWYGAWLGQLFLLGLWLALGGLNLVARLAIVATTTLAGTAAFWLVAKESSFELAMLCTLASTTVVLATHVLLLPLRALLGWRIDFDPAYHRRSSDRRMQLRLSHLIGITTACAATLAVMQALRDLERDAAQSVLSFAGIAIACSLPLAWLVLAARHTRAVWLTGFGMLAASLVIGALALGAIGDGDWVREQFGSLYFGLAATVLANLGLLRGVFGLHLFSVLGPPQTVVARRSFACDDAELAAVVEAWPRLSPALRRSIVAASLSLAGEPEA